MKYTLFDHVITSNLPLILHPYRSDPPTIGALKISFSVDPNSTISATEVEIHSEPNQTSISFPYYGVATLREASIDMQLYAELSVIERTFFTAESLVPTVLATKGYLALHASAVARNGAGRCYLGASGSGKSTQAAFLTLSGWSALSQDVTVLGLDAQCRSLYILPGNPLISLREESARVFKQFSSSIGMHNGKEVFRIDDARPTRLHDLLVFKDFTPIHFQSNEDLFKTILSQTILQKYYSTTMAKRYFEYIEIIFESVRVEYNPERIRYSSYNIPIVDEA